MRAQEPVLTPEALPAATGPMRLISSLRYRDWRYLWSGLMVAQAGDWMDSIAINWLVLVQTNSPLALGAVNLARGLPNILFSLPGGVLADRVDRKALMLWTQVGTLGTTAALAGLASSGTLELWHIFALVVLRSTLQAFNGPARSSVVGDLVPRIDLTNAIALHSTVFNSTRMVGPAIAGSLIALVGSAAGGAALVLWIHTATMAVAIWTLTAMGTLPRGRPPSGESPWGTFLEGFAYLWRERVVLMLMLTGVVPYLLGQSYQSMVPVFAKDVLFIGPQGFGLLTASAAAGGVVGAFVTAAFGDFRRKGLVMIIGVITFSLLVVAFAMSPWALLSGALLFLVGAANQVYQTTNSTLLQVIVPTEYRGRVLGIHQLDRGFIPVGSFIAGAIAEGAGAPFATGLMAACLAACGVAALLFFPKMRRLE